MKKYNFKRTVKYYLSQRFFCLLVVMAMLFSGLDTIAQNGIGEKVVTGTVSDAATQRPLAGARVTVAETVLSVLTDENGKYSIEVPTGSEVLVITYPDYAIREVGIRGREVADAQLYPATFVSGYETLELLVDQKKRKSILTNAADITSADFSKSTSVSIESDIQSRLGADVRTITRSGVPGIGSAMFIRGLNSINAKAQPLIIVDGVYWDTQLNSTSVHEGFFFNNLSAIDLKDIENVTVIKDGNSIYGSKGANGVILITTKRGKDMATRITADFSFGLNQKPTLPSMMDASQYRVYASDMVQGWMQNLDINMNAALAAFPFLDETAQTYPDYRFDTNWSDEVYRNGLAQSIGFAVQGGDDIALYNLSMGYLRNEGTMQETNMDRFNARFNADVKMFEKMLTKVDISISRITRNVRDDGMSSKTAPGFISLIKSPLLAPFKLIEGSTTEFSGKLNQYDSMDPIMANGVSNPVVLTQNALGTSSRTGFTLRINPTYHFNENVALGTTFAYAMSRVKESFFIPEDGIAPLIVNGEPLIANEVRDMAERYNSIFSDTRLTWKFDLDPKNTLALLGGFRFVSDRYNSMLPKGYGTGNDNVKILIAGLQEKSVSGSDERIKSASWYLNAEYDYLKKYLLTLTASADASSRFGREAENGVNAFGLSWGLFPSATAAWLVSSEDFMKNASFINFLKLRVGYGITGNDDIDPYSGRSYFRTTNYTERAVGLVLSNIENETIQWETTKKLNAGLDTHLFNERLALSFDIFSSKTDNLLALKSLKSITGFDYYWANDGELKNNGLEAAMDVKVLDLRNFAWELGGSIGHYKNEVVRLSGAAYNTEIPGGGWIRTEVGQPIGVFYGLKTDGVYQTAQQAEDAGLRNVNDEYYQAGDVIFVDKDGNGKIDTNDRQVIGDPNPDFYGNITNRFKYKKFTLDMLFTYSYGNDVYNYLRSQLESGSTFYNQTTAMVNRWTAGQATSIPRAVYGDPMGNNIFSDRWIEDGSYLRFKTLTLSYDIPFRLSFLQGITVWGSVNNLWTWTNYLGSDPEFSMNNSPLLQGIDNGLTPQGRSYFVGVKVNL